MELGGLLAADELIVAAIGQRPTVKSTLASGTNKSMPFVRRNLLRNSKLRQNPGLAGDPRWSDHGSDGPELLELVRKLGHFLRSKGLKKGDRCGMLAANSIRWIALDLAAMAEGLIVVPLYFRQAPAELVAMMKDSTPALVCCGDATLRDGNPAGLVRLPRRYLLLTRSSRELEGVSLDRPQVREEDPVTIIYTSGTSGEAKGVVLTAANVGFMLGLYVGTSGLVDGRTNRAGPYLSLPAVQFLRLVDRRADVSCCGEAWLPSTPISRRSPTRCRRGPPLFPQRARSCSNACGEQWMSKIAKKGGVAQPIYSRAKAAWSRKSRRTPPW